MLGGAWLLSLSAGPAAALLLLLLILPALLHSVQAVAKGRGGCAGVNTLARARAHTHVHTHTHKHRLRPRAERVMQEEFTDKHPSRAYFESLTQVEQVKAMQIVAQFQGKP